MSPKTECEDEICKSCSQRNVKKCSVCGVKYSGLSRDHLRTQDHKLYKDLFNAMRELPTPEVIFLAKKYVIPIVEKKPKKVVEEPKSKEKVKAKKVVVESSDEESVEEKPKKVTFKKGSKKT